MVFLETKIRETPSIQTVYILNNTTFIQLEVLVSFLLDAERLYAAEVFLNLNTSNRQPTHGQHIEQQPRIRKT